MFTRIKEIHSSEEIKDKSSISKKLALIKAQRDEEAKAIIDGRDKRLMVIVGPCSADNEDAVCDYVSRLAKVYEKIKEKIFIIPRIYTNKPRTRGEGYKGMYHQPDPDKETDILAGIFALRKMHIRAISESGLSAADEMLYPENYSYVDDLLTYVSVGARSVENQFHRLVASGIDLPVGLKNPMNGSLNVLLNSIYAAQGGHEFMFHNHQVKTAGNAYAHAVLRGTVDRHGNNVPNYHYEDVSGFTELYNKEGLKNPSIIIDCNHSNSNKNPDEQLRIVREILNNRIYNAYGQYVKGFMIESYIEDGAQKHGDIYGKSITDACIGWDKTEKLLYEIAEKI